MDCADSTKESQRAISAYPRLSFILWFMRRLRRNWWVFFWQSLIFQFPNAHHFRLSCAKSDPTKAKQLETLLSLCLPGLLRRRSLHASPILMKSLAQDYAKKATNTTDSGRLSSSCGRKKAKPGSIVDSPHNSSDKFQIPPSWWRPTRLLCMFYRWSSTQRSIWMVIAMEIRMERVSSLNVFW